MEPIFCWNMCPQFVSSHRQPIKPLRLMNTHLCFTNPLPSSIAVLLIFVQTFWFLMLLNSFLIAFLHFFPWKGSGWFHASLHVVGSSICPCIAMGHGLWRWMPYANRWNSRPSQWRGLLISSSLCHHFLWGPCLMPWFNLQWIWLPVFRKRELHNSRQKFSSLPMLVIFRLSWGVLYYDQQDLFIPRCQWYGKQNTTVETRFLPISYGCLDTTWAERTLPQELKEKPILLVYLG